MIDPGLCKEQEKLSYCKFNVAPWQKLNNTTNFIIRNVSQGGNTLIKANYSDEYVLLDLPDSYFNISEFAGNYLHYKNSCFSVKSTKLSTIFSASFPIIISVLTLMGKYTCCTLMFMFVIGCSSYLFKFITTVFSLYGTQDHKIDCDKANEKDFLHINILLPAFKENAVIEQLIKNIENLDYLKSKLDVRFLIESDGKEMLVALEEHILLQYFEVIKVPHSLHRAKAKSCNYDMSSIKGKYVVIYDADNKLDHSLQLKSTN